MSEASTCHVGLVQMRCTDDRQQNLDAAIQGIRDAAARGAQMICLPELFLSLYFCQSEDHAQFALAEPVPGPTTDVMCQLARELEVVLIVSLFEKRAAGLYHNTTAVIDADGKYLGKYRKMHIPDDPLFYEKFYFTPGDLGFQVFETRYGRLGVLICWDQWYPEAARLTALKGAEILFYPTAIGWQPEEKEEFGEAQHNSWELIQRSHAVANGCYVVSVNRTGHEGAADGGIDFWGQSFVADTSGTLLDKAGVDAEQILVVPVDLSAIDVTRTVWPFLRDRRIDAYGDITRRYLDDEGDAS